MPLDHYVTLGRSGLRVSPLCLGAMTFGEEWGWGASVADSKALIARFLERGGNFIDTANAYTNGHSEAIIGEYVGETPGRRDRLVIATKFMSNLYRGDPNGGGAGRKSIVAACDQSLRRLRTDYIDLYWMHCWDAHTPIEETMRALDDLVRAGKVRYIGCSNLAAWQLMKALAVSREQGLERFKCTQSYYSLAGRDLEREMIPLLKDQGLGLLVWSPLAGGFLSGKFTRDAGDDTARRAKFDFPPVNKEKGFDVLDVAKAIADRHGVSVAQVAIAWILANRTVTSVIIGARKPAQLDDNLKAVDVRLSAEDLKALDEVSKLTTEYPAWMENLGTDRRPGERRY